MRGPSGFHHDNAFSEAQFDIVLIVGSMTVGTCCTDKLYVPDRRKHFEHTSLKFLLTYEMINDIQYTPGFIVKTNFVENY